VAKPYQIHLQEHHLLRVLCTQSSPNTSR